MTLIYFKIMGINKMCKSIRKEKERERREKPASNLGQAQKELGKTPLCAWQLFLSIKKCHEKERGKEKERKKGNMVRVIRNFFGLQSPHNKSQCATSTWRSHRRSIFEEIFLREGVRKGGGRREREGETERV